jgi:tRNA-2-methylthio-N6-dimethylallyladenosine synthase
MNVHDSEKIAGIFSSCSYEQTENIKDADVIIINTCGIRQKAEQKFYSELGRLKDLKDKTPHLKIAVAGCIAQQKGNALFERFPYVDFIFGPNNIDSVQNWIGNRGQGSGVRGQKTEEKTLATDNRQLKTALGDNPEYSDKILPIKREGKGRAWVSVMYGCDNFCSYCVVPYTRGREKSRPVSDIINEIKDISKNGFKEITLLGQNVNSYGKNLNETNMSERDAKNNEKNPPSPPFAKGGQRGFLNQNIDFPDLLKVIHKIEGIQRIRFVTSHPKDFSEKLIETARDLPKICEHIHLPIQAGSDKILSLMNRNYTYVKYKEKIEMLRHAIPEIAITTDIIVGFPGETDEDFQCTMNALKEIEFDGIFAFKYSKRPNTAAINLSGHINEKTKSERLSKVLDLQAEITYRKNTEFKGKTLEVLVEGVSETDKSKLTGRTRTNKVVNFYGDENHTGTLVIIKILETKQHSLFGEIVQNNLT